MSKLLSSLLTTFSKKSVSSGLVSKKPRKKNKFNPVKNVINSNKDNQVAESTAREIIIAAREEADKIRAQAQVDSDSIKNSTRELQSEVREKSREVNDKLTSLDSQKQSHAAKETQLETLQKQVTEIKKQELEKLEKIAKLTKDQAKKILLESLDKHLSKDIAERIREAEENIKEEADEKAKEILIDSLYHGATDYVAEYTVSTVSIPDETIKGRIIGKDGRNIRAFEKATGVDMDMDENPGEIRLSCFDPVRREIARVALKRLIKDGRIQPTRIEEYVAKSAREIEKVVFEEGKKLSHAVGAYKVPHDLMALLGRFKYRTSYGQNMIAHTLEETKIGMKLAAEIGANVDVVRMGCLFHDIGKVIDEEGSHVEIGVKVLKKHGIAPEIINTVAQHHEDEEFSSTESIVVYIADAISGARPGARYENYEEYIKRLTAIEEIAKSKPGVREAYAIQAGREVRVIVNPEEISDDETLKIALDIRDEIKEKLTYPGTVTVNVIRETRVSEVAK